MDFNSIFNNYVDNTNRKLCEYIKNQNIAQNTVIEAMNYSIDAGGKRLRPVLALAVTDLLGGNIENIYPIACAVEVIHTYSLIHDDLPAMDNDDFRRGKLTNHKVYGEAMAILAGDGLLNAAYELMISFARNFEGDLKNYLKAMDIVASSAGIFGMIGGQVIDLESEGKIISEELLKKMHALKTGALIKAPVMAAAAVCDATFAQEKALAQYSKNLGLAFQIKDDILDVIGDSEVLGKKVGSDEANDKSTFVSLYGLDKSKELLEQTTLIAKNAISETFGEKGNFLVDLASFLLERNH